MGATVGGDQAATIARYPCLEAQMVKQNYRRCRGRKNALTGARAAAVFHSETDRSSTAATARPSTEARNRMQCAEPVEPGPEAETLPGGVELRGGQQACQVRRGSNQQIMMVTQHEWSFQLQDHEGTRG
jgi:hypothetical protein